MGKPFSDLEKRAIAILASGGNPATSPDTAVARYWQWKINPSAASHNLPPASTRTANRKKDPVNLNPFGVDLPDTVLAKVQMTKRTNAALPSTVKTTLGHQETGSKTPIRLKGYSPAYVYWRNGAAETSTARPSRITGRSYKSYYTATDEGFLAPFGQNVATDSEFDRQKAIKAAFGTGINLITFTPEKYRG